MILGLLIGCLGGEPAAPQDFGACLSREDGGGSDSGDTGDVSASFVLTVDGEGSDGDCLARLGHGADAWDVVTGTDEQGARWTVGVSLDGAPALPRGGALTVDWRYHPAAFQASRGHLSLPDQGIWVGQGVRVEDLDPPEGVAFALGDVAAKGKDECGAWSYHDVDATVDGATATVPYGSRTDVGGVTVVHGGVVVTDDDSGQCLDWSIDYAAVALLR